MKKNNKDFLIIGFALFAMFFGAGNLIFPPFLGKQVGDKFLLANLGFVITGVGLPFLSILSCSKSNGSFEDMAGKISKTFAMLCSIAIFLAIGPMLAIPRTAATTYELTIQPMFPWMTPLVSMIIYFSINLCFVLKSSKIIDNIGKFLTPALLITLLTIIFKGIFFPIGEVANMNTTSVFSNSLMEGYQTMDALAGLMFAAIITSSITDKGYKGSDVMSLTIKSGIVAILGLALVYGGLMYLGAQTSSIISGEISKTALLLEISKRSLGVYGSMIIGIAIGLACFTTSVGLITAGSRFFEKVSGGKLSYKLNAIVISLVSIGIGSFGVDKIVKISVPVLCILYPVSITLVLLNLSNKLSENRFVLRTTVYTSLVCSIIETLPSISVKLEFVKSITNLIPLSNMGFAWVIPTVLSLVIALSISKIREGSSRKVVENQ
ncbi:LIVCS family branched-chain amino acid:cation transporter [Clostridium tetanomorphum]|uniref:Branched-chain amino acid transport system carrier protein n=1 Tax=Clostridium tetanomorphum TaxID=1553 RepID=A0A923J1Y4_CLOTT|nr:branched-chain amino acid transport system II carrier protein [Clostridium tetanomorphum]KAJ52931.1 branched-chain amino acid transport system II carrier protein [Clostridium tetanomorphum DSM 665]MBC2398185.1 branched-chain amino acid transport system II carrier protein [Clostridium tetanomorphum]MBP1864871.1 LIVCS family branched-chain amino acid:cation transporter [Clostridium tetanomorphum]NRS83077.1 LIVCS family branched-chain amino acid:cation transporter [Clostridium tetanomorphum]NR